MRPGLAGPAAAVVAALALWAWGGASVARDAGRGWRAEGRHEPAPPSAGRLRGRVTHDPRPAPRAPQGGAPIEPNARYDGRFTFVRIRFEPAGGGEGWRGRDLKWDHDYPRGERHFARMLHELTNIRPHLTESDILTLDDPELMKYPVAYLCEPGFWTLTDAEAAGLRTYLLKGGFIIFDDFAGPHWYNFAEQLRKVLPEARLVPLDASHPIFDSFYHIESLDFDHPYFHVKAQFFGVFEDNDPAKRLMAIVNYNNDIGEYWEWSDEGWLPIQLTNEAYKLGVNYVVYAMTH